MTNGTVCNPAQEGINAARRDAQLRGSLDRVTADAIVTLEECNAPHVVGDALRHLVWMHTEFIVGCTDDAEKLARAARIADALATYFSDAAYQIANNSYQIENN